MVMSPNRTERTTRPRRLQRRAAPPVMEVHAVRRSSRTERSVKFTTAGSEAHEMQLHWPAPWGGGANEEEAGPRSYPPHLIVPHSLHLVLTPFSPASDHLRSPEEFPSTAGEQLSSTQAGVRRAEVRRGEVRRAEVRRAEERRAEVRRAEIRGLPSATEGKEVSEYRASEEENQSHESAASCIYVKEHK
ncbi:hypothetical protein EYF80_042761 [Liparis tanakae]|uniref:Uncharacterized protein n=1 Tax=Liparis tanakae TaxID=230148 RepID=A0A4Z2G0C4_9TELE|nr:hypothetical protein EYF80_042761 [Liparis tanakae]